PLATDLRQGEVLTDLRSATHHRGKAGLLASRATAGSPRRYARGLRQTAYSLRLRAGRCRLWAERAVPSGADTSQVDLGCRHPPSPQGLSCRRAADLASRKWRAPATCINS